MIDRKDIFMSGFKQKIGYSFTYKDLNEFEAVIDFYEQQCKKQKEIINKIEEKIKENIVNAKYEIIALTITDRAYYKYIKDMLNDLLEILEDKEVSE